MRGLDGTCSPGRAGGLDVIAVLSWHPVGDATDCASPACYLIISRVALASDKGEEMAEEEAEAGG